jgi:hypothetical protein
MKTMKELILSEVLGTRNPQSAIPMKLEPEENISSILLFFDVSVNYKHVYAI